MQGADSSTPGNPAGSHGFQMLPALAKVDFLPRESIWLLYTLILCKDRKRILDHLSCKLGRLLMSQKDHA